jgi:hypothetical protein
VTGVSMIVSISAVEVVNEVAVVAGMASAGRQANADKAHE